MTSRRDFLTALSALPAAAATAGAAAAHGAKAAGPWDLSWTARVTGRHRGVFDCPNLAEGAALWRAASWRRQVEEVDGTPIAESTSILVVRADAMALVMDDAFWARFGVGEETKTKDRAGKEWATANPWRVAPPEARPPRQEYALEGFLASGGIVLACNLAFRWAVAKVREADKRSAEDADRVARAHLVPGVLLQPSGYFAAIRAQEAGCHYFQGS